MPLSFLCTVRICFQCVYVFYDDDNTKPAAAAASAAPSEVIDDIEMLCDEETNEGDEAANLKLGASLRTAGVVALANGFGNRRV
jgi:hypothetical protein